MTSFRILFFFKLNSSSNKKGNNEMREREPILVLTLLLLTSDLVLGPSFLIHKMRRLGLDC